MTEEMSDEMVELTALNLGCRVLEASDDFFAPKENLIKPEAPIFAPGKYTDLGKWMDGWESRRRRGPGYDWCILRLGVAGIPRRVNIDTAFFDGNHPESASLDGAWLPESGSLSEAVWTEILAPTPLGGNSPNTFDLSGHQAFQLIRLNIYPDGGVARLRLYGEVVPDWDRLNADSESEFNLAGLEHGARVIAASDMHFGSRQNLILPGRPPDMREGWETRRRRGPGYDWCVLRLACSGIASRIEVDTTHFKGNYPDSASVEGCLSAGREDDAPPTGAGWLPLVERTPLRADFRHYFDSNSDQPVSHVRLNIHPDGGVSRLRVLGKPTSEGWKELGLKHLNALPGSVAASHLLLCCGSRRWAQSMVERRPFQDFSSLQAAADRCWKDLQRKDFLEAFGAHPKIGEQQADSQPASSSRGWSNQEQRGVGDASQAVKLKLKEGNQHYWDKFGYIFIVNATGKSAQEMLDILQQRLGNDPEKELETAAEQQRQITGLRLEKLFLP